jgi:spore maturation protein CgeB
VNVVLFSHSVLSDWNHGNAHFQRGVISALQAAGHHVTVFEPLDAWSVLNAVAEQGEAGLIATRRAYPNLTVRRYSSAVDLNEALANADLVLVHEWNPHELVAAIGEHHVRHPRYVLLFHDTHHRSVSEPASMAAYDLSAYDGVLAFGEVIRRRYLEAGWATRAWTWHEAADTRVFRPRPEIGRTRDLVWIGNWGDEERTAELHEFLIAPVRALRLTATVYGVRYPRAALNALAAAGIEYRGWLPNYQVPEVFAQHRVTVHVPRRPYVQMLPGIPTIRPFEAMACGIPLVSAAWQDTERLFAPGDDYLVANTGEDMTRHLHGVMTDQALASSLEHRGVAAIRRRHTCDHRAQELLTIVKSIEASRLGHSAMVPA